MTVKEFCEKAVEGYLLHDLEQMARIRVDGDGNCGYPMAMAVLSGIELLGTLTYPHRLEFRKASIAWTSVGPQADDPDLGKPQFDWYWRRFLTPTDPSRYRVKGQISELIRALLRNGLAHVFLAKPGIEVRKFDPDSHMRSSPSAELIIDSTRFAEDFKRSYWERVRPILDGKQPVVKAYTITAQTMQDRLDELTAAYALESGQSFARLSGAIPTISDLQMPDVQMPSRIDPSTVGSLSFLPTRGMFSISASGTVFPDPNEAPETEAQTSEGSPG